MSARRILTLNLKFHRLSCPLYLNTRPPLRFLHQNPHLLDSNEYTQALYDKLSAKSHYEFLDTNAHDVKKVEDKRLSTSTEFNEFLRLLASGNNASPSDGDSKLLSDIERTFSEKFTDWTKVAQLRIGFLMYRDKRIKSDEYLDKVIKHLASGNLYDASPHDLVALMLLIYFRKDISIEDFSSLIDPALFQNVLYSNLQGNKLTSEEVCAICLGLKKIRNLKLDHKSLRQQLYEKLEKFTPSGDSKLDDFFIVTLLTTLSSGNMIYQDNLNLVREMLSSISRHIEKLSLDPAIKLLCSTIPLGMIHKDIETKVVKKVGNNLDSCEFKDLRALCSYFSKQYEHDSHFLNSLLVHAEMRLDSIGSFQEFIDLIDCFHFLSHKGLFSESFNRLIFGALKSVQRADDVLNMDEISTQIWVHMSERLRKTMDNDSFSKEVSLNSDRFISVLTRIPAFIYSSYEYYSDSKLGILDQSFLFKLHNHFLSRLPLELYSPQMDGRNLNNRYKLTIAAYRSLVKLMGNEHLVKVTRILPHFDSTDIVFGNIGGVCMSVPPYITDPNFLGVRRPPPGEWWAVILAQRKHLDENENIIGQEALKVALLQKLGYSTIVIPTYRINSSRPDQVFSQIAKALKTTDVKNPNLCDGYSESRQTY